MSYKQRAFSIKCELPSSDAVVFKTICPVFVNEAQILTGSSGVVYSSKQSMVLRGNFWTVNFWACSAHPCSWPLHAHHNVPFQGHRIPSACRELQSRGGGSFCREWFGEKNWISSFWKKSLLGCLVPLGFFRCIPWNLTQTVQAASAKCLCTLQRGSCRGWDRFLLPLGLAC